MFQTTRPRLLTSSQVAEIFHVHPKTVRRWAESGKLSSVRTASGHRRYRRLEVEALYQQAHEGRGGRS